jgi:hypothetical protein
VEEANATLQVSDHKITTDSTVSKLSFRMTKVAAIKANIARTLATMEEANATLQVGYHKITTNIVVSKCYSG